MPAAPLPITRVSINPNSGAARQNDDVHSHSQRTGPAVAGTVFAGVLARRSGTEVDRGTKAKTAPDPAAKVAAKSPSVDSSVEQGKDKSKTASKDSKAAAQAANVLLAAPQVSVASSRPNGAVGKAQLQRLAKEGRIVPGPSGQPGSLLPESPGGDTKLIGKRIDTVLGSPAVLPEHGGAAKLIGKRIDMALGSPAVLLDHGGVAKTLTSKPDQQGTDTIKLTASSKDPSTTLLKSLFTQNLATLVGRRGGKDQGQAGADFKQGVSPGWVGSPIGLSITPTATSVLP
ncbi:MAG TPA: hypothetical protein ENI75_01900, partial [Mizugakiibacter sp.]|nr:hypothetical protein [Mizugakiibacter sp.]